MVRECRLGIVSLVIALLGASTGCSLVLDFSDSQIPIDAAPDARYNEALCGAKEPNDSLETAALITSADVGPAAICPTDPEDTDFYKFTVPAGTGTVEVKITFMNRPDGDLDLKLLDAAGTMLSQSRGFADTEAITCPGVSPSCAALSAGDYVFEVFPALAGATNEYAIALTLTPI